MCSSMLGNIANGEWKVIGMADPCRSTEEETSLAVDEFTLEVIKESCSRTGMLICIKFRLWYTKLSL